VASAARRRGASVVELLQGAEKARGCDRRTGGEITFKGTGREIVAPDPFKSTTTSESTVSHTSTLRFYGIF
jgi:hypothetical protein